MAGEQGLEGAGPSGSQVCLREVELCSQWGLSILDQGPQLMGLDRKIPGQRMLSPHTGQQVLSPESRDSVWLGARQNSG